ncbi:MAG: phosphoglycerate kinase [Eggerthellaceae bacterium]|nr:phosphoglycerate kinase [Eggerthellaceae bacterium]
MQFRSLYDAEVTGKRVLVRVDLNAPIKDGQVSDDTRIRAILPTVTYLVEHQAKVILASHRGRPAGTGFEADFSLQPVTNYLSTLLDVRVEQACDVTGVDAQRKAALLQEGEVLVLENVRFDAREKKNDPALAQEFAALADIFVNDAFGTAHRAHASTEGVAHLLPSYAGLLLESELETLGGMLEEPKRPLVAIIGGSKVSDKIGVLDALLKKADIVIVGGGMCFTFLEAQGYSVGASLKEQDWVQRAHEMIEKAKDSAYADLLLPTDVICADKFAADANILECSVDAIPDDMMGLDIGPQTATRYKQAIASAKTVFWNGPMGVFEMPAFEAGTRAIADAMVENADATTIVGGGDSVAAVRQFGVAGEMTFISTGGGASMKLVEGAVLPGVAALAATQGA